MTASLTQSFRWFRRAWPVLAVSASLATLVACGGGGGGSSPDAGGTQTGGQTQGLNYTVGEISGFGSVIVNGVRYDDTHARLVDDDGATVSRDELALGATVEIRSDKINSVTGKATASEIRVLGSVRGPVESVDLANSSLVLLGQTVRVLPTTVFDSSLSGGLSAVSVGQVLRVFAQLDPVRNELVATRISAQRVIESFYKVRGVVAALDTAAKTFQIGNAVINYANVARVPDGLANGAVLRVQVRPEQVAGQWVALAMQVPRLHPEDQGEAEVRGLIDVFTSSASFEINGLVVDASNATFRPSADAIVLGARVEVHGAIVNGVLVATRVEIHSEREDEHEFFELHGAISGLDTAAKTFVLRGVTVSYAAGDLVWGSGVTEASLANGLTVEVKGSLSADGTTLTAARITGDD